RPAAPAAEPDEVATQATLADLGAPSRDAPRAAAPAAGAAARAGVEAFGVAPAGADSAGALRAGPAGAARAAGAAPTLAAADAAAAAASVWTPVDRAEAERRLGGKLILVEGLDVASIEAADSAGAPRVRVRQPLGAGAFLELVQRRSAAEKTAALAAGVAPTPAPRRDSPAARPPEAPPAELVL